MPDVQIPEIDVFEAWLETFPPETSAGHPLDDNECPIANWLRTLYSDAHIAVGEDEIEIDEVTLDASWWVEEIVCRVDMQWEDGEDVTAGWCLEQVRLVKEMQHAWI